MYDFCMAGLGWIARGVGWTTFPGKGSQRQEKLENKISHGKFKEHKPWQKVMETCDQSLNLICAFFADIQKLSICLESLLFPTFSPKCYECKI